MDMKQRAALVRELRLDTKERQRGSLRGVGSRRIYDNPHDEVESRRDPSAEERYTPNWRMTSRGNSRSRIERGRTRSRHHRPRAGEGADAYIRRTNDSHGGGDISYAAAARTYDLRRPRGSRPAPHWASDYAYGYNRNSRDGRTVRPPRGPSGRAPAMPGRNR
jgi:hypothetical protein